MKKSRMVSSEFAEFVNACERILEHSKRNPLCSVEKHGMEARQYVFGAIGQMVRFS